MTLRNRARVLTTALASSLVLGLAACGEDDVERNIEDGAKETREAARDAKKADEAEKGANELERELQE